MEVSIKDAPKCNCEGDHQDLITFLNEKTDEVYRFRDRYFETHDIEEAVKKEEDTEKLRIETLKLFTDHERLIEDADRAKFNYLKGKLLNVSPTYSSEAEILLSKSIKLDPKLVDAWNELGECYWKNDELKKSINCFEGALKEKRNKHSLRSLSMLVRQEPAKTREQKVKNIENGLNYAKEAVQLDPHDGLSWTVLGNAYLSSFFGIQQNPKILKQCLSAYSQAEKDIIAKSTPDLHYNKGITLKYEEEFKLALESFNEASVYNPTWEPPKIKEKQLVQYLNDIKEFASTCGKMKSKRLQQLLQSFEPKQLGPYGGGAYTSPIGQKVNLTQKKLKELNSGINDETVVLGKVVCSVRNEDRVPFTFCMVDKDATCVVVTIFNLADGKGVIIGDSVAIAEPYVTDVDFIYKEIEYKFRLIRVENPVILVVNGKKVSKELQAEVQMSIFKKND
ncbi:unnamed protein product [Phyllotreta striolata]|uniref:Tetratricopeptide repeat protein 5 OB fold domain-containing protein n=1 Tax=Phyllotreta striolata TaxID=444603 RepID=A0A9N9TEF9_PHYSR|nr:unnamed protein product [Phyllotreta striolata]